jgi:DNA-binding CsgD family transcriptional regulator
MRKVLQIAKVMPPEEIAKSYDKIAAAFIRIGKADSAFYYSSKAVLATEKNNSPAYASYLVTLANSLEIQQKYSSALVHAKKAYNLAVKQRDTHTLRAAALLLSDIYYHINKRDLAYTYLSEYLQLNDSITNLEFMRKVTRLDIQHEYEKKQKEAYYEIEKGKQQIEILNKTNELKSEKIRLQWIILSAIVLLSLAGASISFLLIKNKNHRIGKMSLELHNYLLRENEEAQNQARKENTPQNFMENYGLTQREAEILEEISIGLKNNEIAQKLFVSENTVKFHIKNIYIKLDVKNRIQALQKANS